MSGRRLLDAIRIFNVTRNVAGKHIALQRHRLDVHARTSSLTKGAKLQADRIGLAIKAAAELARKLNDSPPSTAPGSDHAAARVNEDQSAPFACADQYSPAAGQNGGATEVREAMDTTPAVLAESETISTDIAQPLDQPVDMIPKQTTEIDVQVSKTPSSAQTAEVEPSKEPSEEMIQQLFRSRKTSASLFRKQSVAKPSVPFGLPNRLPVSDSSPAQHVDNVSTSDIPVEAKPVVGPVPPTTGTDEEPKVEVPIDSRGGQNKVRLVELPLMSID